MSSSYRHAANSTQGDEPNSGYLFDLNSMVDPSHAQPHDTSDPLLFLPMPVRWDADIYPGFGQQTHTALITDYTIHHKPLTAIRQMYEQHLGRLRIETPSCTLTASGAETASSPASVVPSAPPSAMSASSPASSFHHRSDSIDTSGDWHTQREKPFSTVYHAPDLGVSLIDCDPQQDGLMTYQEGCDRCLSAFKVEQNGHRYMWSTPRLPLPDGRSDSSPEMLCKGCFEERYSGLLAECES
jgi:hypothetical protein